MSTSIKLERYGLQCEVVMDMSELSCNWKRLKAILDSGKAIDTSARDQAPKRKLTETTANRPTKRRRQVRHDADGIAPKSSLQTKPKGAMGAYVSSLPTASYGLTPADNKPTVRETAGGNAASTTMPPKLAKKYVALDCEMVGTRDIDVAPCSIRTHDPKEHSVLGRVSIVGYDLEVLYDAFVLQPPGVTISDFRTQWSGITADHLRLGNKTTRLKPFAEVQREVEAMIDGRVLVGHALKGDLGVLGLSHPNAFTRDTSKHAPFREMAAQWEGVPITKKGSDRQSKTKTRTPSLKRLAHSILGWDIQESKDGHDSIEDAKAAMALYKLCRHEFERSRPVPKAMKGVVGFPQQPKAVDGMDDKNASAWVMSQKKKGKKKKGKHK